MLGLYPPFGLGLVVSAVSVVGGGSKNRLWRQILADLLNAPVVALSEPESAALGGALQALWVARREKEPGLPIGQVASPYIIATSDAIQPNPAHVGAYKTLLAQFEKETKRLYQ